MGRGRRRRRWSTPGEPLSPVVVAVLVFLSMLSSTLLIPALRPFFAAAHPESESGLYGFMTLNMLGAFVGAPILGAVADALGRRATLLVIAAVLDGALLFLCSLSLPLWVVLGMRTLQGAANVGSLALLMSLTTVRGVPVAGGATIAAIACGAPLGTVLLKSDPALPLQAGAMLPLFVAGAVAALQPAPAPDRRRRGSLLAAARTVMGPGLFVFAERFAIGLFIVPFSLLCHHVRGLDDATTGRLYAAFLVPFALATGLVPRVDVKPVVAVVAGSVVYASALASVGRVDVVPLLALVLAVGGVGAALVYAPSLRVAALAVPGQASAAMGALQAMGALGMLLGSGAAGVLAKMLAEAPRAEALRASFDLGAVSLLVLVAAGAVSFARTAAAADRQEEGDPGELAGGKDAASPSA